MSVKNELEKRFNRIYNLHNPKRPQSRCEQMQISKLADAVCHQMADNISKNASSKPSQRDLAAAKHIRGAQPVERTEATLKLAYEWANGHQPDRDTAQVLRQKAEQAAHRHDRKGS